MQFHCTLQNIFYYDLSRNLRFIYRARLQISSKTPKAFCGLSFRYCRFVQTITDCLPGWIVRYIFNQYKIQVQIVQQA